MDVDRRRILNWLASETAALAPVYEGAVKMALDHEFPGRVRFVTHAVREIWNRLPDEIAPPSGVSRADYSRLMDVLAVRWEKEGLPPDYQPTHSEQLVSVPFLKAVAELLEGRRNAIQNRDRKTKLLFGDMSEDAPTKYNVGRWTAVHDWAVSLVHVGLKPTKANDEESLVEHFRVFEEALTVIMDRHYEPKDGT